LPARRIAAVHADNANLIGSLKGKIKMPRAVKPEEMFAANTLDLV
jgi:hypothetical protein